MSMTSNKTSNKIASRLALLEARIKEANFLRGAGLGNEVNFHVFDYEPELEPVVTAHLPRLQANLESAGVRVLHLDLYDLVLEELKARNLLERSFAMEQTKGSAALEKSLGTVIRAEVIVERIKAARVNEARVNDASTVVHDLLLLTGVGAVFPLLRSHTVLNQLHSVITEALVLFFPGSYNGSSLELFDRFEDDHYYRAFPLVPRKGAS